MTAALTASECHETYIQALDHWICSHQKDETLVREQEVGKVQRKVSLAHAHVMACHSQWQHKVTDQKVPVTPPPCQIRQAYPVVVKDPHRAGKERLKTRGYVN